MNTQPNETYSDVIEPLIAMEKRVNQELFAKYSHGNGFSKGLDHLDTVLGSFYSLIKLNGNSANDIPGLSDMSGNIFIVKSFVYQRINLYYILVINFLVNLINIII